MRGLASQLGDVLGGDVGLHAEACGHIVGDSGDLRIRISIAEATVKVHRSRAMQKMKAGSLPELGRMVDKLQLLSDEPQRS